MAWRRHPLTLTLRTMAAAVDVKGGYVPGHSDSVAYLMTMMGREVGYSEESMRLLELAAYAHDVGKLRLPDSILLAERPLSIGERELIRQHPIWSASVTQGLEGTEAIVPWVLHHHEHFDGSGYPEGLVGDQIPWASRMLLVADAFQVMTVDRPYQVSRPRSAALEILQQNAGTQFCPTAVELLLSRGHWQAQDQENELASAPIRIG
jgi:HD-GYP domain-containing protein (c-di-GMP phosphodiesterase class II)